MYLEMETRDSKYVITEIRSIFWLTTGGYAILDQMFPSILHSS